MASLLCHAPIIVFGVLFGILANLDLQLPLMHLFSFLASMMMLWRAAGVVSGSLFSVLFAGRLALYFLSPVITSIS